MDSGGGVDLTATSAQTADQLYYIGAAQAKIILSVLRALE